MDDKERQAAQQDAQEERAKGADLEYDAQDESILGQPASSSNQHNTSQQEKK